MQCICCLKEWGGWDELDEEPHVDIVGHVVCWECILKRKKEPSIHYCRKCERKIVYPEKPQRWCDWTMCKECNADRWGKIKERGD